ncbi:MAG: hypothetical protein JKY27_11630 [Magnetovibrio sp.]|nr:hypothetical protein [Magnetovibrio sp.]
MIDLLDNVDPGATARIARSDVAGSRHQSRSGQDGDMARGPAPTAFEDTISISPEALQAMENDPFYGLSNQEVQVLDDLFASMDAIFAQAGSGPLSASQEKQLDALDRKVGAILGDDDQGADLFALLSDDTVEKVDELFGQMDAIFAAAGNAPLNQDQEAALDQLDQQIQQLISTELGSTDPFAGLPAKDLKALDQLFTKVDAVFETAQGQALTFEQSKMLRSVEQKMSDIVAAAQSTPPAEDA